MGFTDRLANAYNIFVTSFSFIKRDKSLLIVPIFMLISGLIFCGLIVLTCLMTGGQEKITGWVFLVFLVGGFWSTFLGAMHSWMVHEVAQGKDTTVFSGFKRAMHNLKDIIAYAVVFMVISIIIGAIRKQGRLGRMTAGFLSVFAGIIGKLILPAMIVTERSFGESIRQLKHSTKAIPEIATYEIGVRPLTTLAILFGAILAFIFAITFGAIVAIPFAIAFLLVVILATLFINNTYYTLLYLTLIEKKRIKGLKLR